MNQTEPKSSNQNEKLKERKENRISFVIIQGFVRNLMSEFIPTALIVETGERKKRMDDTITTTRFTQLPTEWVTGDTLCSNI